MSRMDVPSAPDPVAVGATIRDLRRRRHYSQTELGRRIGMRPQPLNNIERGRNLPSTPVLYRIAAVLEVPVDILLNPAPTGSDYLHPALSGDQTHLLRESSSIYGLAIPVPRPPCAGMTRMPDETPPIDAPMRSRLGRLADAYLGLEDLCGAPKRAAIPLHLPFEPSVAGMTCLSRQVRRLLGIGDAVVFDYLELFENAGLRVLFLPLPDPWQSLSCYDADNGNALVFVADNLNSEKQLFRLLYELGRVYLHTQRRYGGASPNRTADGEWLDDEHAARAFAARFLMPDGAVQTSVNQTGVTPDTWRYPLLLRLKHRFGVSAEAFCIRLEELRLIDLELAGRFKTRIRAHYGRTAFHEPGDSRRMLSPNGRLGDLRLIARRRASTPDDRREYLRLFTLIRDAGVKLK